MAKSLSRQSSVRASEKIDTNQFNKRREIFDKYDTVFLPASNLKPGSSASACGSPDIERKFDFCFKRTASMREPRAHNVVYDRTERQEKLSGFKQTSELLDDVDYRYKGLTERTRRLSRLRSEFLASNLHEPSNTDPFTRNGMRASLPAKPRSPFKREVSIYKFAFAEPFNTPPPTRKVYLDFGSPSKNLPDAPERKEENYKEDGLEERTESTNGEVELFIQEPVSPKTLDELKNKYKPEPIPVDWTLPPTKPRIVNAIPKSAAVVAEEDDGEKKYNDVQLNGIGNANGENSKDNNGTPPNSLDENDIVPEMKVFQRQRSRDSGSHNINQVATNYPDKPSIIDLLQNDIGSPSEERKSENKKIKRKKSFLNRLFNRKTK